MVNQAPMVSREARSEPTHFSEIKENVLLCQRVPGLTRRFKKCRL